MLGGALQWINISNSADGDRNDNNNDDHDHDDHDNASPPSPLLTFFAAVAHPSHSHVVFVGGLTDGLFPCRAYLPRLQTALADHGHTLVQVQLRSALTGFGSRSISDDVADLAILMRHLVDHCASKAIHLIGHSTGCQDIIALLASAQQRSEDATTWRHAVKSLSLQGPVSDRLYIMSSDKDVASKVALARRMASDGRGRDYMPPDTLFDVPITPDRFLSLTGRLTDDDMFSPDLTDDELLSRLGHLRGIRTLWIFSMLDEYVPPDVDQRAFGERLKGLFGCDVAVLEDANHDISIGDADSFIQALLRHILSSA